MCRKLLSRAAGSKKNLANYVKYVATREGSVTVKNIDENAPATKNQQELILSLLNDFPDSKELFEYEDYVKNPTIKNGSALIFEVIDRNMDRLTNRKNYVGYLANRPGAVKYNSHGLFKTSRSILKRLQRKLQNMAEMFGRTLFLFAGTTLKKWVTII